MALTLRNATLMNLDPLEVSSGSLRIEDDIIVEVGPNVVPADGDDSHDCRGAVVLPGLVNGHTHLYSALAAGMTPPAKEPQNFVEILKSVWWRLDRAHDSDSIELSGRVGALDALRCGTTTLIDHHASPNAIAGSLDQIERGIAEVGLRAMLCYEVTERNGRAGAEAGLEENRRYLDKCKRRSIHRFAALVGAHTAFTLGDEVLKSCVEVAREYHTGVHIHVAEDPCDDAICREKYGAPLIDRLQSCGLISPDESASTSPRSQVAAFSILAHGTHLSLIDAGRLSAQVAAIAHNPRSNMNNRVGHAPVEHMSHLLLGTDGIGADMFTEAKLAWFKARDAAAQSPPGDARKLTTQAADEKIASMPTPITPARIIDMLAHSARVAGKALGCTLGKLTPGAAADIIITDYIPATPLSTHNAPGHFLFAMGAHHVCHVIVSGQWLLRDHRPTHVDAAAIGREAIPITQSLWQRMQAIV